MYLSRVKIDVSNRRKVKDLNHLGAYHKWVEDSFPNEVKDGYRSRKLWRIDQLGNNSYLLILSQEKPDKENLEKFGVKGTAETKDYNVLLNQLQEGDKLLFRLVLNPVMSLSRGKNSGKRGRVIPLVTAEQQLQFLKDRAAKHGFSVNDDEVIVTGRSFEVLRRKNQKPLKICTAAYSGLLTIENLELFKKALTNGIGKNKAFGCGLLTVIPGRTE